MLDASVVISAYTEERWTSLITAITSAQTQAPPPREIIVVVDHNESLLERARSELTGVAVIPNQFASGLSGARNSGVAFARGAIVAFLDDDAEAAPYWLQNLVAPLSDASVIGTGGRIEPRWLAGRPSWFPDEFLWTVGCSYAGMPSTGGAIRNPIGASMAMRVGVLREIGGFREGVGASRNDPRGAGTAGTDETELAVRAQRRWPDRRWVYAPDAVITHDVPATRSTWTFYVSRCRDEGRAKARLAREHGPRDSLASERHYALRALPKAVVHNVEETVRRRRLDGALKAAAIVAGFAVTVAAYLRERFLPRINPR